MYMGEEPAVPNHDPAWFRRLSFSCPTIAHELVPALYWRTSGTAFGHWPHPARMMVLARNPEDHPKACDSSHGSVMGALGFHAPVPLAEASSAVWAKSDPAMLTSPPMA